MVTTTQVVPPPAPVPAAVVVVAKRNAVVAFCVDIWSAFRPYGVFIIKDWLIAVLLWATLWAFHGITTIAKIDGWSGDFIVAVHGAGVVIAFGTFAGLLVWDVIDERRKHA